ncbi:polysaccharide deacetylase family protein [Candidatus Kaiserbacteria bacterium]|nr:polysaccharide deacetylase family protein [Candidatus Kaiserbacteria bacterium]
MVTDTHDIARARKVSAAVAAVLFSLFVFPGATYAQSAPNLIQNSSFETSGTNGNPANWARTAWGTPTPTFTYPVSGNGSAKAVQMVLQSNSTGDGRWQPAAVTVEAGATYTYTTWYKSNVATEIDVAYTKSNGSISYGWIADVPSSGNVWKQFTASFTVPSGSVKASPYHILEKTGTLAIDDVSLVKASTTPPPPPPGAPTLTFTASPTTVTAGQQSTLSWQAGNVTSCTASGAWSGSKSLSGSATVAPTQTSTYTLSCTGSGGNISKQATVTVSAQPPPPQPGQFTEGMVSLTFDDSWTTQYTNALPILQQAGVKGTFYLTTQPIQEAWNTFMTPNQVKDIAQKGHEIAGHTITHADLTTLSQSAINREIKNSKTYLQNLTGQAVSSFAHPYGAVNNTVKNLLKLAGYTSARGIDYESLNLSTSDKYDLKSMCIETSNPVSEIKAQIDGAKANKQWFILCIHEVKDGGDQYTMTPAKFQEVVNYIKSVGIKVVTVKEGWALMAN